MVTSTGSSVSLEKRSPDGVRSVDSQEFTLRSNKTTSLQTTHLNTERSRRRLYKIRIQEVRYGALQPRKSLQVHDQQGLNECKPLIDEIV